MPAVYTIEGTSRRDRSSSDRCKRVKTGRRGSGCTIETCKGARGRWKFQKGTRRCSR